MTKDEQKIITDRSRPDKQVTRRVRGMHWCAETGNVHGHCTLAGSREMVAHVVDNVWVPLSALRVARG